MEEAVFTLGLNKDYKISDVSQAYKLRGYLVYSLVDLLKYKTAYDTLLFTEKVENGTYVKDLTTIKAIKSIILELPWAPPSVNVRPNGVTVIDKLFRRKLCRNVQIHNYIEIICRHLSRYCSIVAVYLPFQQKSDKARLIMAAYYSLCKICNQLGYPVVLLDYVNASLLANSTKTMVSTLELIKEVCKSEIIFNLSEIKPNFEIVKGHISSAIS